MIQGGFIKLNGMATELSHICKKGEVDIRSRNNKSFNEQFYPVLQAMQSWKINAVVDGEIVAINEEGFPDFGGLQNWRSEAVGHLVFYAFDILWMDGDLMKCTLFERRKILKNNPGRSSHY